MPVYDKPMIYYPVATLLLAAIRDILIITTPATGRRTRPCWAMAGRWGVNFQYAVQPSPDGLAQAFLIGEAFIGRDPACLILGDNIYYGQGLSAVLRRAATRDRGATVFGYYVRDPEHTVW